MVGRSHLLVGLAAGVVLDSVVHLTGPALTMASSVPPELLVNKSVFYFMLALGSLLPDIDNAHSTLGRKLGWISKEIQHVAGHRTLFHSLLGLFLGSLLAIGLEQLVVYLLARRGFTLPAQFVGASHLVFIAVLFGCIMHIAADSLTEGGVPLLKGSTILNSPRFLRAQRRILLSLFPRHVGKPEGLLRATVAADLDRYTTQISDLLTQASDASLVHQT